MQAALGKLANQAQENGLEGEHLLRLHKLLRDYRDVFRLRLGPNSPAMFAPMEIKNKENPAPVITKARRYTKDQREWMDKYITKLQQFGMVNPNPTSSWAVAPLFVPKPPPANFRLTFDYRPINAVTVSMAWPMPHIESELMDVAGSAFFAKLDFCSGY